MRRRLRTGVTVVVLALQACGTDSSDPVIDPPDPEPPTVTTSSILVKVIGDGLMRQDAYEVLLDGVPTRRTVSAYFSAVVPAEPGDRVVSIQGLPAWCTAADSSRAVTVVADRQVSVEFRVTCSGVQVRAATTGVPVDVDGYRLVVDGDTLATVVPVNGSVVVGVVPGTRAITLGGVASHCRLDSGPETFEVVATAVNQVAYALTCLGGVLRAEVSTDGEDRDGNGYDFTVRGGQLPVTLPMAISEQRVIGTFPAGTELEVALDGVAKNCQADASSRSVEIRDRDTVTVAFAVSCTRLPSPGILMDIGANYISRELSRYSPELAAFITVGRGGQPIWSQDGSRFAFSANDSLYVADRGVNVPTAVARGFNAAFSADARQLYFLEVPSCSSGYYYTCDYPDEVRVVSLESGAVSVVFQALNIVAFDLSPDGTRIAYIKEDPVDFRRSLIVSRLDGSDAVILPVQYIYTRPLFSPDGDRLLVYAAQPGSSGYYADVRGIILDVSGAGAPLIFPSGAEVLTWSPDGARVLFRRWVGSVLTLYTLRATDGQGYEEIARLPQYVYAASWK